MASASNTRVPRFFARFAEPEAEAEDAFTVPDWGISRCPHCNRHHREVLYAFPPQSLINCFVAKAQVDGVRALLVVPLAVTAPYWNKLLQASVLSNAAGYVRLKPRQGAAGGSDASISLAVFAVDFGSRQSRLRPSDLASPCARAAEFRGRPLLGGLADQAERSRIHSTLLELRSSLRWQ